MTKPTRRVRQRPEKATRRRARAFGDSLREWLHGRAVEAEKRNRQRREADQARSRGVDRVPDGLRVTRPEPLWVHRHEPIQQPGTGRWLKGRPYTNPARDQKPGQQRRLRKDQP